MTTPIAPLTLAPPDILFQRATVAFDDFCRSINEYFEDLKSSYEALDLTTDIQQIEAMLLDRVVFYAYVGQEESAGRRYASSSTPLRVRSRGGASRE